MQNQTIESKNLKSYYENLPKPEAPKTKFVTDMSVLCNVTSTTVRNWVKGKVKPNDPEHVKILVAATGISEENLFIKTTSKAI
jgi:hypothetical protein